MRPEDVGLVGYGGRRRVPGLRREELAQLAEVSASWPAKAHSAVAMLRMASGLYPDDPALAALIGELSVKSPEFAALWADHRVKAPGTSVFELCHPLVGSLTVTCQFLGNDQGQHLAVATEAGSPSHAALTLLGHVTGRKSDLPVKKSTSRAPALFR